MALTYDPAKNERNIRERGLSFDLVAGLSWSTVLIDLAPRQEIAATRFVALGEIDGLVYVVVFTFEGADLRVISLRRANAKERKRWLAAQTPS